MYNIYDLGTLDAVENGAAVELEEPATAIAIQAVPTGTPTTATLFIFGSLDGVTFYDISGTQAASGGLIFFLVDKPVKYLQARLTVLSGGSSPSVQVTALATTPK